MKKQFLAFAKQKNESDLPQPENEVGGAGNAESSGANEQANASRSGEPLPEWYDKNKDQEAIDEIQNAHKNNPGAKAEAP